jgi:Cu(I)/Ag(I) efflux system membrane fusion protein
MPLPIHGKLVFSHGETSSARNVKLAGQRPERQRSPNGLNAAVAAVDGQSLTGRAQQVWQKEKASLAKLLAALDAAEDLKTLRAEFSPLSDEIAALVRTFGFGEGGPIYQFHCPMAFQGRGAIWLQNDDQPRNPYYGSTMLRCADRVGPVGQHTEAQPQGNQGRAQEHKH